MLSSVALWCWLVSTDVVRCCCVLCVYCRRTYDVTCCTEMFLVVVCCSQLQCDANCCCMLLSVTLWCWLVSADVVRCCCVLCVCCRRTYDVTHCTGMLLVVVCCSQLQYDAN